MNEFYHRDPLTEAIRTQLKQYFTDLNGATPSGLYELVVARVERALFEEVLIRTHGNLTRAAELLGITRNTLRRKLKEHRLYPEESRSEK